MVYVPSANELQQIWLKLQEQYDGSCSHSKNEKNYEANFAKKTKEEQGRELEAVGFPRFFYKYQSSPLDCINKEKIDERKSWLESLLVGNKIHLSSPSDFNDPFDVYPNYTNNPRIGDIRKYVVNSLKIYNGRIDKNDPIISQLTHDISKRKAEFTNKLIEDLREYTARTGIFCATTDPSSVLMWSHYADCHKGICIEFDNTEDVVLSMGFLRVNYDGNKRPTINPYLQSEASDFDKYFLVKAKSWKYEEEWRMIYQRKCHEKIEVKSRYISKVILGAKASEQTRDYIHSINEKRVLNGCESFEIKFGRLSDVEYKIVHD